MSTFVRQIGKNCNAASTSDSLTLPGTPTTGNRIVLTCNTSNTQTLTPTDVPGVVTWSLLQRYTNQYTLDVWIGTVGASPSATINVSAALAFNTANCRINAFEVSTLSGVMHSYVTNTGAGTANPTSGNITPPAGANVVVVNVTRDANAISTPTNSFTQLTASGGTGSAASYRIINGASGSAYSTGWTAASGNWDSLTVCIFETAPTSALHVSVQPYNEVIGYSWSPAIEVEAWTNGINRDTSVTQSVSVAVQSGNGVLAGPVTLNFVAGRASFPAAYLSSGTGAQVLRFTSSGYIAADTVSFTPIAATPTVEIVAQPDCVMQGALFTVTARRMIGGLHVDSSYTGNMVASLTSGTGSIASATNLTKAATAGVVTWTDLSLSTKAAKTVRVTESGSGAFVSLSNIDVRETAYATTGAFLVQQSIRDSFQGMLHKANIMIPAGATAGTPLPIIFFLSGSGKSVGDPSTNGSAIDPLPSYVSSHLSTFPAIFVNMPLASVVTPQRTWAFTYAIPEICARLQADGYNISDKYYYGWSTGGINGWNLIARLQSFWSAMVLVDPSISGQIADDVILSSAFADSSAPANNLAVEIIDELARLAVVNHVSILFVHSIEAYTNAPPAGMSRNIFSQVESITALTALGVTVQQVSYSSGTTQPAVSPANRYAQIRHTTGSPDHSVVDQHAANNTNWPGNTQPWLLAQTRPTATSVSVLMHHHLQQMAA